MKRAVAAGARLLAIVASVMLGGVLYVERARAFPPYRSTDADTADPGTIELRTGLIRVERTEGQNEYKTPLMRLNLGLPGRAEIISELEYAPKQGRLGDAAIGAKWAPIQSGFGIGIEALALLPVRQNDDGIGFEGQMLATLRFEPAVLHFNAGGFHDARRAQAESGWRGSLLMELPLKTIRPGIEVFAKKANGDGADFRVGPGVIVDFGRFDLRAGLHAGLTDQAPDVSFSLWVGIKFPLQ